MRVLVTGASGWIGSAVVPELLDAGHQVVGLARSDRSARRLAAAGAIVQRRAVDDVDGLAKAAADSDGVIHLAFGRFTDSSVGQADVRAIDAMGDALRGSGRPLVLASGLLGLAAGRAATEQDNLDPASAVAAARPGALAAPALAARGVRASVVRLAASVHGEGDHAFIPALIGTARDSGVSGYIGDGSNRWPAVHILDAARLFRLALEQAPAGSALHGAAEEGVPVREIAQAIGRQLDLPVVSISPEHAGQHFGWLGAVVGADMPASSALTRQLLGWEPTGPGLLEDIVQEHYYRGASNFGTRSRTSSEEDLDA